MPENVEPAEFINFLIQQGYNRISTEKGIVRLDEPGAADLVSHSQVINIIIDRLAAGQCP